MSIKIKDKDGNIIKELEIDFSKTLLKQIKDSGIEIDSACNTGICGACLCLIESGGDNLEKNFRGEPGFPLGEEEIMTCIGGIKKNDYNSNLDIILRKIY